MSENKYNFTIDKFEIGQNMDLSTALKNIKEGGVIELTAKFPFAEKMFVNKTSLFYNDVFNKSEEQIYEILNERIEGDIHVMQSPYTQVGFGQIVQYIARNISEDLSVKLCEDGDYSFDSEDNKFFYDGSSVSQITMRKSNQSITEKVVVFNTTEYWENPLSKVIQEIENKMSEQIKIWLKENSTQKKIY